MKKLLAITFLFILMLSACTKSDIRVQGFMTSTNGQPIEGLTVSLDNDRKSFEVTTDQIGYYVFNNVPIGTWNLSIGKGSYLTHLETFSVSGGSSGNIYQKNFTLTPIKP